MLQSVLPRFLRNICSVELVAVDPTPLSVVFGLRSTLTRWRACRCRRPDNLSETLSVGGIISSRIPTEVGVCMPVVVVIHRYRACHPTARPTAINRTDDADVGGSNNIRARDVARCQSCLG